MVLRTNLIKVQEFLNLSSEVFELEKYLNRTLQRFTEDQKLIVLDIILSFVQNFSMFRDIKPFMKSVYNCIVDSLEIRFQKPEDYRELLVKSALMHFIQEYIDYSQLEQKKEVLRLLSGSLENLQLRPLIINLGLMLKPMYSDEEYLNSAKVYEEELVCYDLNDDIEIQIKQHINNWLSRQELDLENQATIKKKLEEEFNQLVENYKIARETEKYDHLCVEVSEMLNMKLTLMSLMDSIAGESFKPVPIK